MMEIFKPQITVEDLNDGEARFIVGPLERGYGTTLGNALRRVLFTDLPGAAVVGIKIEGVRHEFDTLKGVREDIAEIILNLKEVAIKVSPYESFEPQAIQLKVTNPGVVKAGDITAPTGIEIINKDAYICTLSEGSSLNIELLVGRGKGYVSANENKQYSADVNFIAIDSLFSPVKAVSYHVSDARVEQKIDYDELVLNIKTNAASSPTEVISLASQILVEHLRLFIDLVEGMKSTTILVDPVSEDDELEVNIPIENLDLSVRSLNCLKRRKIHTVKELIQMNASQLSEIKNLGKKSLDEILGQLDKHGFKLAEKE